MKHKGLVFVTAASVIGCATVLGGCRWHPFGRDYFVTEDDGKAGSSYGEPWINSNTYGTVNKDTTPTGQNGDDIYLSANFEKIIATELTEGQKSVGVQEEALEQVSSCLLDMMKNKGSSEAAKQVNALYELYTDTESRKNAWTDDILPKIKTLQDVQDLAGLSAYLCSEDYFNNGESIVSFDYDLDYNDPATYSFVIIPTSLSLGDAAEYSGQTDYGKTTEDIYLQQAKFLLKKAGYSDDGSSTIVQNSLDFEKEIAAYMNTQEFKYSADYISSVNNPVNVSSLEAAQGSFPLSGMLSAYGIADSENLYIIEPKWLEGMKELYTEENFDNIKSYILIKTLQGYADSADEETYSEMRDIYYEAYGIKTKETVEDYAYSYVKGQLPGTLDRQYVDLQINEADKLAAEEMVRKLTGEFKNTVDGLSFLGEDAKSESIKKLENMKIHVAYSDTSPSASAAEIKTKEEGGNLADAVVAIRKANRAEKLKNLNRRVSDDDTDADMTDINVKYYGLGNSLVISAGALKGYFSSEMSEEEKLGGLGMLVAAELANAVLKGGSSYNAEGKFSPYWSEEDVNAYAEEYKELKDELDAVKPFKNDTKLDGARVLDDVVDELLGYKTVENLADSEGLDIEKLKASYAKSRFTVMREDEMEKQGLNSTEALPYIKINLVTKSHK